MRLNQGQRETIASAILAYAFDARQKKNTEEMAALAIEVRNKGAGKHLDALMAMPREFVYMDDDVAANINGQRVRLWFDPVNHSKWERTSKEPIVLAESSALAKRVLRCSEETETISRERRALRDKVNAALMKATTFDALLKDWPEIKKYLPPDLLKKTTLPAIRAEDLNREIEAARKAA